MWNKRIRLLNLIRIKIRNKGRVWFGKIKRKLIIR